jgi:nicotinamidase-related amidase
MKASALVVVDMINPYEHPEADRLAASAESVVPKIAGAIGDAKKSGIDVVYCNDNFGDWSASTQDLIDRALDGARPDLVRPLLPTAPFCFVTKLRHSAFFATPLEQLLREREIERTIVVGQATEQCILYSALDAYMRGFELAVPRDCLACIDPDLAESALAMIERNMDGETGAWPSPGPTRHSRP